MNGFFIAEVVADRQRTLHAEADQARLVALARRCRPASRVVSVLRAAVSRVRGTGQVRGDLCHAPC